ncbi:hypothetical protein P389DRAFT_212446 [Cystobasidium minutum MCA 4210]|uniref:uncharacterized protein n=1 Tax=Cystobasidium minutum MCA 4210 TaxID=1397322 RepID=UPI0034CED061|eukprot:jgi/Rhomi1/212446/estExt_Genemark1.C_60366
MASSQASTEASMPGDKVSAASPSKAKKPSNGTLFATIIQLRGLSMENVTLLSIFFVLLLHIGALSLFTRGFLLKRTTLEPRNDCDLNSDTCVLEAKFERTIILLVDALRYDFLFPVDPTSQQYDPAHHNHLTVPISLSQAEGTHSLMYKSIADPPTTTLQRLKAITTGSLPTFVDAGSNFAGSRVDEDNWLDQANRAGKRIAFMGDDTWLTIFPESVFAPNLSFPFDSFNVEDLDTVDAGVRAHLIPLLDEDSSTSSWDIAIAHPLGLDHAGHRFGASHAQTTRKLREVNDLIRDITERMAVEDLLIVMGDHGMDSKGDHGGDSPEEVESALWMYSKTSLVPYATFETKPFADSPQTLAELLESQSTQAETGEFFNLDGAKHRVIPQISLVPTLCLLLGIPLPLNNLGTLIPELFLPINTPSFWRSAGNVPTRLMHAMRLNAEQMQTYLKNYAAHPSGSDLAPFVPELVSLYEGASASKNDAEAFLAYRAFTYATLRSARSIWARFNPVAMLAGLAVLLGSLGALGRMYKLSKSEGGLWKTGAVRLALARGIVGMVVGIPAGLVISPFLQIFKLDHLDTLQLSVLSGCLSGELGIMTYRQDRPDTAPNPVRLLEQRLAWLLLALHTASFASNSYILWEDWVVLYLGQIQPALLLLRAATAVDPNLRTRIIKMSLLSLCINRLISISTVCREEQHPYCHATFYGNSGVSISSPSAIIAALLAALTLPSAIGMFLDLSKSRQGWAPFFLRYSFRGLLVGGVSYWAADYLEYTGSVAAAAQLFKVTMARVLMMFGLVLATTFWKTSPLCVDVKQTDSTDENGASKKQVAIIGYANSIGSSYLIFYATLFGFLFILLQPIGQVVSCIAVVSLLALVEAIDNERDSDTVNKILEKPAAEDLAAGDPSLSDIPPPSFLSISSLALWGFSLFFATGHQAVLSAIQWKTAFVGFPTLTYPFSPLLVILNTLGPFVLSAAAIPLLVLWNVAPSFKGGKTIPILSNLLTACLGFLIYHTTTTLSSAIFAAHLRRHLMVWKVFAPRFMLSAMTLLVVDLTVLVICIGWGGLGTLRKLANSFGTVWR